MRPISEATVTLCLIIAGSLLGLSLPYPQKATEVKNNIDVTKIEKASLEDVLEAINSEEIELIDARSKKFFEAGTIPTARNIPRGEEHGKQQLGEKAVIFCSNINCKDSEIVAKKLLELGWKNIKVYKEGFEKWKELSKN